MKPPASCMCSPITPMGACESGRLRSTASALLAVVSRLVAIDFGRVIGEGAPQDVMNSDAVRQVYLGIDA